MTLPYCFDYCSFVVYLKVKKYYPLLVLLFQYCWTFAESLLFHENVRVCFADSLHQSFCTLLKPVIYPVSGHSYPSSVFFSPLPVWEQEGEISTLILWQRRFCEVISNLEELISSSDNSSSLKRSLSSPVLCALPRLQNNCPRCCSQGRPQPVS